MDRITSTQLLITKSEMGNEMTKIIEANGYDESGIIGRNLRFVRVGMTIENSLRPFVYNLLHFRSVSATKRFLSGISNDIKIDYIKKVMNDPAIDVTQYQFSTDHQIDILRQFTLLEEKSWYKKRREIVFSILDTQDLSRKRVTLENLSSYLKRYERAPYWMESFIKSYGFRMITEDLAKTSRILIDRSIDDYKVISYVDGGFPFVFWWRHFLNFQSSGSRFSPHNTPIFGVTKGDEYYPATSMAGNIAYITSTTLGMVYPHNILELPTMNFEQLNDFYSLFSQTTNVPTFQKRILFVGYIPRDFQYLIPFILHIGSDLKQVFEPFRLRWKYQGTLKTFYRTFGYYPENDMVILGSLRSEHDKEIAKECYNRELDCQNAEDMIDVYKDLLDKIKEQSEASNLNIRQRQRVSRVINFAKEKADELRN
jgi:hypothetical protein